MKFSMRDLLVHADNLMTDEFLAGGPRVSDVNGYTLFPGFLMCMCISESRVFLIKRPS